MTSNNTEKFIESFDVIVELKYISLQDYVFVEEILTEDITDKEFVLKVLFNQLVRPPISFEKFIEITEQELISLGESFIENNHEILKHFDNTSNFFRDFKHAFILHKQSSSGTSTNSLQPYLREFEATANLINKTLDPIMKQSLSVHPYIHELQKSMAIFVNQLPIIDIPNVEALFQINSQLLATGKVLDEYLRPQIVFWQKWIEDNEHIYKSISDYWINLEQLYNISELVASEVLRKYKWFITPSIPASFINELIQIDANTGRQDKAVNKLFIQYFADNNWENLDRMVVKWKENLLFSDRYKIIKDCIEVIKLSNNKKINVVNVVLPTLITQIDGLISDYLSLRGLSWDTEYEDFIDSKSGKIKKIGRKTILKDNKPQVLSPPLDDLATEIFLNILFQRSRKGENLATPFNFNRHKIVHGENKHYGRKDYLIRAFLVLDFLAHISESEFSEE